RRCGEHALAIVRRVDDVDRGPGAAGADRGRCRRWFRGGRARRLVAVPGLRRRRGHSRSGAVLLDDHEHLADGTDVAVLEVDLADRPGARRRQLDGRLVGHHLDERLVELDLVAHLDLPRDDLALDDTLTDIRHVEIERHGYHSSVCRIAFITRSALGMYSCSSAYGNGVS